MTDTGCTNGHGTEIITGPNLIAAGLRIDCFRLSLCFFCCCPALRFLYGRRGNQRCTFLGAISLKYELAGYWSRRINSEHRIIYSVHDEIVTVYVLSMRYHYAKR